MRLSIFLLAAAPLAAQCTFSLNPPSLQAPASPDTLGTLQIIASASNCARTATTTAPDWLTITFGNVGTGNGSLGYRVFANRTPTARAGAILVGGARFNVTQAAGECSFTLSATSSRVDRAAGNGSFQLTTDCQWSAASNAPWLRVTSPPSGAGNGTIAYAYDENSGAERTGVITVGNRMFTLTQTGAPCTITLNPTGIDVPAAGSTGTIAVSAACAWTAVPSQTWITVTAGNTGNLNGSISYRVTANTGQQPRAGAINVSGQLFQIRQAGSDNPAITSITNAASFVRNLAAPGAIVAVFGSRLGPAEIAGAQLTPDGLYLSKSVAGTRVLFDGTPGAIVYTRQDVVAAIVPYNTAGKPAVKVAVEYQGARSNEYDLPLAAVAPAVFTQQASGSGPGAVQNSDFSLNTIANPAQRGSFVIIYATGEGLLTPPAEDGKLTGADLPQAIAPVDVFIGGARAEVLYKGGAVGATAGLLQINAIVPMAAQPGMVTLDVRIGGVPAQSGVTMVIR
jgi:uncharacterized protein (TIGR03437 family)